MSKIELQVSNMSCGNCVKHVTHALQEINGVQKVEVDLAKGLAVVEGDLPADLSPLIAALEEEGYPAKVM